MEYFNSSIHHRKCQFHSVAQMHSYVNTIIYTGCFWMWRVYDNSMFISVPFWDQIQRWNPYFDMKWIEFGRSIDWIICNFFLNLHIFCYSALLRFLGILQEKANLSWITGQSNFKYLHKSLSYYPSSSFSNLSKSHLIHTGYCTPSALGIPYFIILKLKSTKFHLYDLS